MDYSQLIKLGKKAYEMLKEDQNNRYSLLEPITYPPMKCDMFFSAFQYEDDYLKIDAIDESHIQITIKPFDGNKVNCWDGVSLWPDDDLPMLYGSLLHDMLYWDMKLIAASTGKEEYDIRHFADVAFANLVQAYGGNKTKTRLVYTALRAFGGLYHKIKDMLLIMLVVSLMGCSYPTIIDDVPPNPSFVKLEGTLDALPQINNITIPQINSNTTDVNLDESIKYKSFGNPDCSKCVEDKSVQIKDLKITKSGLSYKWAKGNLSNWGLAYDDASALAIIGYEKDGQWKFCKFDWISSSRTTRDYKNINSGYNGINADEFFSAKHHGFFIMSKNGKKRTNVITD